MYTYYYDDLSEEDKSRRAGTVVRPPGPIGSVSAHHGFGRTGC